jgi:CHRD domain-containing protein
MGFRYLHFPILSSVLCIVLLAYSGFVQITHGQVNRYWVALVPDVISDGTGFVGFKFSDDFKQIIYTVNVHNIADITGVYLFLKNDTQGKSPVLDLLKKPRESNREDDRWSNTTKDGKLSGTINLTGVTKKDLTGALAGKSIESLLKLMRDGELYIAVYTKSHPDGELIGDSFVGMDDVFHDAEEFNW